MTMIVLSMFAILGLAAVTAGVVVLGMQGRGHLRAPRLVERVARLARYLDGEGSASRR